MSPNVAQKVGKVIWEIFLHYTKIFLTEILNIIHLTGFIRDTIRLKTNISFISNDLDVQTQLALINYLKFLELYQDTIAYYLSAFDTLELIKVC